MIKKKMIAISMSFVLILSMGTIVFAEEDNSGLKETVAMSVSALVDLSKTQICSIGEEVSAYVFENDELSPIEYDLHPILADGEIVAFAEVVYNENGSAIVNCNTAFADALEKYRSENQQTVFALIYSMDGVHLIDSNEKLTKLYDCNNIGLSKLDKSKIDFDNVYFTNISKKEEFEPINMNTRSADAGKIQVPFVKNATVSGCESACAEGLCWAAVLAMMSNYYNNTDYSAIDVHDLCGCDSSVISFTEYQRDAQVLGLTPSSLKYSFTYANAKAATQANKLNFIRIHRYNSEGDKIGHVVLGNGYYYSSTNGQSLYYVDPNYGSCVSTFPSDTSSNPSFTPVAGRVYTFTFRIEIGE